MGESKQQSRTRTISSPDVCRIFHGIFSQCGCEVSCKFIQEHCTCSTKAHFGMAEPDFNCVIHGFYGFMSGNVHRRRER